LSSVRRSLVLRELAGRGLNPAGKSRENLSRFSRVRHPNFHVRVQAASLKVGPVARAADSQQFRSLAISPIFVGTYLV
jgi:hypothetical protein